MRFQRKMFLLYLSERHFLAYRKWRNFAVSGFSFLAIWFPTTVQPLRFGWVYFLSQGIDPVFLCLLGT